MTSYSNYGFQKFALPGARVSHNEHALRPRLIQRLGEKKTLATRVVERTIHKITLADTRSYKVVAHLHVLVQRIDTWVGEMRTLQTQKNIGWSHELEADRGSVASLASETPHPSSDQSRKYPSSNPTRAHATDSP